MSLCVLSAINVNNGTNVGNGRQLNNGLDIEIIVTTCIIVDLGKSFKISIEDIVPNIFIMTDFGIVLRVLHGNENNPFKYGTRIFVDTQCR